MNLAPVFRQRFFDQNGVPLAGGKLYSYVAGTTTLQGTYSNATGTTNTNPVVLDSQGYGDVWLDPTLAYKFVLQDAGSVTLWTADNVTVTTSGISTWNTNTTYAQGALVQDNSGYGLLYVSLISNNVGNALTNVSAWRIFDGNVRTVSTNTTLSVTDNLVRSNSTSGNLTHTLPAIASTPIGKKLIVKDVGTGGNSTTLQGHALELIDGSNTLGAALGANDAITVMTNGTSWDVL